MAATFAEELVVMHDEGFSVPSVQVSLERHLALLGSEDPVEERRRLAAAFAAKRSGTHLADDILKVLREGT